MAQKRLFTATAVAAGIASTGFAGFVLGQKYANKPIFSVEKPSSVFPNVDAASMLPAPLPPKFVDVTDKARLGRVPEIMRHGFPSLSNIKSFNDFVLSYDQRNRCAHWVFEHLTAESVKKNDQIDRAECSFREDTSIHPYFRATNADFRGSGYDRGHLAAAANHRLSHTIMDETFQLSNIAPQVI